MSRIIVLDTETTGLEVADGHRIIEIGAVELVERRLTGNNFHEYIDPQRMVDAGAFDVHGISNEFLDGKPLFPAIIKRFVEYISGAELVIHNAPFDVGFLNEEFRRAQYNKRIEQLCEVTDSYRMARKMFPGKRNSLDALCDRLAINNSHRKLHGALLDSEILADVFLLMTGGQESMNFDEQSASATSESSVKRVTKARGPFKIQQASVDEVKAHTQLLETVDAASKGACCWSRDFGA